MEQATTRAAWLARLAVGGVGLVNLSCAGAFWLWPADYAPAFNLEGVPGQVMVRALGLLFVMWTATYPLVFLQPARHLPLFGVIVAQQVIGLAGETWLWLHVPAAYPALRAAGLRFIAFDGVGLVLLAGAGLAVWRASRRTQR